MPPSLHSGVRLDERDRISDTAASGFTAVNGRTSPRTLKLSGNGSERRHSRASLTPETDCVQDRRPLSQHPDPPDGPPTPRPPERDMRLSSPAKRKRSLYEDEEDAQDVDTYSRQGDSSSPSSAEDDDGDEDDDDLILVDENGEPAAQTRDFAAMSRRQVSMSDTDADADAPQREYEAGDASRKGDQRGDEAQSGQSNTGYGSPTQSGAHNGHMPMQTKHGYPEPLGIYPRPAVDIYPGPRPPLSLEEARSRSIIVGEERPSASASSSISWAAAWPSPSPSLPNRAANGYSGMAPPSDTWGALQRYQEQNSYRHGQSGSSTMAPPLPQPQQLSAPQSAMTAAQLAPQQQQRQPSIPQHVSQPLSHKLLSEKEKMLSGGIYTPFAPSLLKERQKCKAALWRFNNAVATGASLDESMRLFRDVLRLPSHDGPKSEDKMQSDDTPQSDHVGFLGEGCWIETPFRCDFGYNVRIGDQVAIEGGCTISDARTVVIGNRCILGHNVSIYTSDWDRSPRDRQGVKGTASAMEVVIEDGVCIEADVTILPGARIGKNSRVAAGSLVDREAKFPENKLIAGRPAVVTDRLMDDAPIGRSSL
ncbi:bacterial transferase hexapeptide [Diplodia corticola]|uniref:Bacterial transferase hexapeptide n=1 Tax=Diplodia corticola TaxID=236234 RepID=A0A1J9S4V6_9PEZI|nr:bacterial transferase hexapeptide [Diplodia corticola]OJD34988.1 bacterial transferase hexapeptide [Diplodia corticola]